MSEKNSSVIQTRAIGGVYLLLLIVGINAVCTQFVAGRLSYNPVLGEPLFARFYNPFAWWEWFRNFYSYAPNTYHYALLIFAVGLSFSLLGFRLFIGFKTRSSRKHEGSHGTAAFATHEQVKATGLIHDKNGSGVYCGGYHDEKTGRTYYLRHDGPEHVAVFAPTGSGKGVGLIIPTLLSWPESVFVLDIKGENYAMTAGWRQNHTNSAVLRFDPANPIGSCAWNPINEIRFRTRYQISDAQNIALMVIDEDGKGLKGHWMTAAHELIYGVILHALYKSDVVGRAPSLPDCAFMLTGTGDFKAPETNESQDQYEPKPLASLFSEMMNITLSGDVPAKEAQLQINSIGTRFFGTPSKELGSIISTALNALTLYRDPIVGKNTSRSDFKIADLMDHDLPLSLYFVTNPNDLVRMKPLARLLITRIVAGLCGNMEFDAGRGKTEHKYRLLMMLDEFPVLGKLEVFEKALAYIRGYGIKAYIITQDVQQLYQAYTNYESILSNCGVQLAYAPNNQQTTELLSKMCGKTTVIKEQISTSGKRFGMVMGQVSRSYQESQRDLMTPDEIRHLPKMHSTADAKQPGEMLIFMEGHHVIKGRQTPYFLDPVFNARSKIPPPKESDKIRTTISRQLFKVV
jgi:type IV secretion system protein VirD4